MERVAVIGAGVAGLGAAYALRGIARVDVFEAGPRAGGRARTCAHGPARYDMGAQFFRTESPSTEHLILGELPGLPVDIAAPVHAFDDGGVVSPGDPAQNAQPKWTYPDGIAGLASRLLRAAGANVRLGTAVAALNREAGSWALQTGRGAVGPFAAVVCAAPSSASIRLLRGSALPGGMVDALGGALDATAYRPIISVAFGVTPRPLPLDAYALVNVTRGHAVSWVASERHKPGYLPGGVDVIVAQMAAAWSGPRLDAADRFVAREAWQAVTALLGRHDQPRWSDVVRWPHALPDRLVDRDALAAGEPEGLFFATDAAAGGRVYLALDEGVAAGGRVSRWLTRA